MPLVAVNKARRKEHQDRASAPVQVEAWNIEARHEDRFKRAVIGALREIYTEPAIEALTSFLSVIRTPIEVDSKVSELLDTEKLRARLQPIYRDLLREMDEAELARHDIVLKAAKSVRRSRTPDGWRFEVDEVGGFNVRRDGDVWRVFGAGGVEAANPSRTLDDVDRKLRNLRPRVIAVGGAPGIELQAGAAIGIPISTTSVEALAFVQSRTTRLIAEVTEAERRRVNQIISREFLTGRRVVRRDVRDKISATVGLLAREERLVQRAAEEAIAGGATKLAAERIRRSVADRLLRERGRRIARTETVQAQNEGKIQAWGRAQADGQIPQGTLKTWIAATNSQRTCKICGAPPKHPNGLDRQQVPLGEQFFSEVTGLYYDRPPAHVQCRCTMTLGFPEQATQ